jgi:undecaprenyl-diphosphatase
VLAAQLAADARLSQRLLAWRQPAWFRASMLAATRLGDGWLWLLVAFALLPAGEARAPCAALGAAAGANAFQVALKLRVRRPRPSLAGAPAGSPGPLSWFEGDRFSFPSGHALNAFAGATVLAMGHPLLSPVALLAASSIGLSRVVLRLHWPSDVLAGGAAGATIGAAAWLLLGP